MQHTTAGHGVAFSLPHPLTPPVGRLVIIWDVVMSANLLPGPVGHKVAQSFVWIITVFLP